MFGFFLGRALDRYPGIHLHAVVQMSNHLHMVVTDRAGELSRFMRDFLGPLARAINEHDDTRGPFFERRYAATEIIDDDALLERIVYTLTNPVASKLVEAPEAWPGVVLGPGLRAEAEFSLPRPHQNHEANENARASDAHVESPPTATVRIRCDRPMALMRKRLQTLIQIRLSGLTSQRNGRPVLGRERVVMVDVFGAPDKPKRSRMPLCHAGSNDMYRLFKEGWRAFVNAYRRASASFRQGILDTPFPEHCFKPSP